MSRYCFVAIVATLLILFGSYLDHHILGKCHTAMFLCPSTYIGIVVVNLVGIRVVYLSRRAT
jgi:hypothetical protein